MVGQLLCAGLAEPLSQTSLADEISGDLRIFSLGHVPIHYLAASDIEAAHVADIRAAITIDRHDLPRRQSCEFRLVAGEEDPLALLLREAMRHQGGRAFTAIQAVPITRELTSPALQCCQPHAQQLGLLASRSTRRYAGIIDHQCYAPILGKAQFSSSSPQ